MTSPTRPDRPELVLNEEQLQVALRSVPVERVKVHRRVRTYTQQVEVTLRREEIEIEHLPLEADPGATTGTSAGAMVRIVLREEVPVVTTRTRPYEQVTVTVGLAAAEEAVTAPLRSEQVEVDRQDLPGR